MFSAVTALLAAMTGAPRARMKLTTASRMIGSSSTNRNARIVTRLAMLLRHDQQYVSATAAGHQEIAGATPPVITRLACGRGCDTFAGR